MGEDFKRNEIKGKKQRLSLDVWSFKLNSAEKEKTEEEERKRKKDII